MILDAEGEEGDEGLRRRQGRGDKYKKEVEREVERIKVKVRNSFSTTVIDEGVV